MRVPRTNVTLRDLLCYIWNLCLIDSLEANIFFRGFPGPNFPQISGRRNEKVMFTEKPQLKVISFKNVNTNLYLKFGDGDGPKLCRLKKVDVSSTFIENIFRSQLTLVSSNDIITIKIVKNFFFKLLKITRK